MASVLYSLVYPQSLACDFAVPLSKQAVPVPHFLNLGWPCDLPWAVEGGRVTVWQFQVLASGDLGASVLSLRTLHPPCEHAQASQWLADSQPTPRQKKPSQDHQSHQLDLHLTIKMCIISTAKIVTQSSCRLMSHNKWLGFKPLSFGVIRYAALFVAVVGWCT